MSFKGRGNKEKIQKEKPEFDQQIVDLARVTRVTKGGKQLSFRAVVLIGDRHGRVGYGVDKGKDVQLATAKAFNQAKKNLITIPLRFETIPHMVGAKFGSAKVMLKPAPQGSGIIAGGSIRGVLEMAGVPNASAKMLGKSGNKMNNIKATFLALQSFKVKAGAVRKEKKAEVVTEKVAEKVTKTVKVAKKTTKE